VSKSRRRYEIFAIVLIIPGVLGILASGIIFLGECSYWLKEGIWPGWTLASEFGTYPDSTGYLGIDKIIRGYFDVRMSLMVLGTSISWLLLVGLLGGKVK
jgi:hypothetical protein